MGYVLAGDHIVAQLGRISKTLNHAANAKNAFLTTTEAPSVYGINGCIKSMQSFMRTRLLLQSSGFAMHSF